MYFASRLYDIKCVITHDCGFKRYLKKIYCKSIYESILICLYQIINVKF